MPPSVVDGRSVRWARSYAKIEIASTTWRPLRISLHLYGSGREVPGTITLAVEDKRLARFEAQPGWHEVQLVLASVSGRHERFDLQLFSTLDQEGRGVGLGDVVLEPILTAGSIAFHAAIGAFGGALALLLFLPLAQHVPSERLADEKAYSRRRQQIQVAAVFLATLCLLTTWALVIPPYQVPDEPQHAMRAASSRTQLWLSGGDAFELDPRYVNPIAKWPGGGLGKLFFRGDRFLTKDDVLALKNRTWNEIAHLSVDDRTERWPGASYPPLYYLAVFGLGHGATTLLGLSPYQSTFAYRLASVLIASGLWALLFARLRRSSLSTMAIPILLFLLMNPGIAFTAAGVNPDAFAIPLCAAAMLACWEVLETGAGERRAFLFLLAAALMKPSGVVVGLALLFAMTCLWLFSAVSRERVWRTALAVARALLVAFVIFYAWSRPRFQGGGPVTETFHGWALHQLNMVPAFWISFWGWLGWQDYQLPGVWYALLFLCASASAVCALAKPLDRRTSVGLGLTFLAYTGLVFVGEFMSLRDGGYSLAGRHFHSAALGLSPLLLHRVRVVRWGFLVFLIVMHVALFRQTLVRYYGDDWLTFVASLPFG